MLVQTRNLPNNLPEVYIECVNGHSDDDDSDHHDESSSEEDDSRSDSRDDDDDDDESDDDSNDDDHEKPTSHHRAQELKIRVYNHTVQFKNKRRVVVSIKGYFFFYNILSYFPLAPFWSTQYRAYEIISFF